jgi:hypothetical protein
MQPLALLTDSLLVLKGNHSNLHGADTGTNGTNTG